MTVAQQPEGIGRRACEKSYIFKRSAKINFLGHFWWRQITPLVFIGDHSRQSVRYFYLQSFQTLLPWFASRADACSTTVIDQSLFQCIFPDSIFFHELDRLLVQFRSDYRTYASFSVILLLRTSDMLLQGYQRVFLYYCISTDLDVVCHQSSFWWWPL